MKTLIAITLIFWSLLVHAGEVIYVADESGDKAQYVSLISLIVNPDIYDGKKVVTEGYFSFQHEDVNLYISKEDYLFHRVTNRTTLSFYEFAVENPKKWLSVESELKRHHGASVTMQGVFRYMPQELFNERVIHEIEYVMVMDKKSQ